MKKLEVLVEDLPRRQVLIVCGVGAALAACGGAVNNVVEPGDGGDDALATDASRVDASQAVDVPPACTPGPTMLGPVTDYPAMTWTMDSSDQLIVGHDSSGLFAFSNVCTHAGCAITLTNPSSGATDCRCHGSQFDGNGNVVRGPARAPLVHYAVSVCSGVVYVDTGTTVPETTRVAVGA